jgi:ubiquinone/menaquinone biosynthesis C-methylase UbiE
MGADRTQELQRAALAYEELFVPALFEAWAPRVLDAARIEAGDRVLDVACGTGVLARAAAGRAGRAGAVAGADVNAAMLEVAARIDPGIEWQAAPAEDLPFDDQSFDAVVSQFGLMFFSDPAAAAGEMHRVLVPGGRAAVAVFDALENVPAYEAMAGILDRLGHATAASALRVPFAYGDTQLLATLFEEARFATVAVATDERTARFSNVRSMVLADVKGWFPVADIMLDEDQLETLVSAAEQDLERFVQPDGSVEFATRAHIVSATRF